MMNKKFSQVPAVSNPKERDIDTLLDTADLLQRMHVCRQTLQRWRTKGLLPYYKIEGKIYYKQNELSELITKHKKQ